MAETVWDKEIDVPEKMIQYVDDNVSARLPQGSQVRGIFPYGASYWTRTAEIQTEQLDGSPLSFFLKVSHKDVGKGMMSGELVSMTALHDTVPDLVPTPVAWGTYASDPSIHFFLCSFHDMTDKIPDVQKFTSKVAELHRKSVSPNGKYGFPVPTYQGRIPQETAWADTWEQFFTNSMKRIMAVEEESQGADPDMQRLKDALIDKVIPRLLRPLETGGRQIRPCLVHSDLWDGNTSTDVATDLPIIFDAPCLYAHNEYELAPWRPTRHKIGNLYVRAYHTYFPVSAPEEDHDDRNALYCIRFNMCSSALYPGNHRFRPKGFEWVFWCLVIFGGGVLGTIGWTFPETARNVVGNGSVQATGWGRTWWSVLRLCWGERRMRVGRVEDANSGGDGQRDSDSERKRRVKIPNPLSCLRILFWKDTSLVLWMSASFYAVYYCIQASIPSTYKQIYHFNELEIGLAYLTGGAGVILGGYTNGKMMDSNYKITAKKIGHTVDEVSGDDLKHFPIERARARGSWYLLMISTCTLIGYGWALEKHAHESIPLILQFLLGFLCTCFNQTFSALLVDIFPASPSTAAASGNITRCALSALAVAVMQPLLDGMGRGWFFTFLGILSGVGGVAAVWAIQAWGTRWRGRRISDHTKARGEDVPGGLGSTS